MININLCYWVSCFNPGFLTASCKSFAYSLVDSYYGNALNLFSSVFINSISFIDPGLYAAKRSLAYSHNDSSYTYVSRVFEITNLLLFMFNWI